MVSTRRKGMVSSTMLLDAAEELIAQEGLGAVTARRLAEKVGLKRQIVHYYFGTIEDLIVALIRRNGDLIHERAIQTLKSDDPLKILWEFRDDAVATVLELTALALRQKAIQAEVKRYMAKFRKLQIDSLSRYLELRGLKPNIPPAVTAIIMMGISQTIAIEGAMGMSEGHAEIKAFVEEWLLAFATRGESPRCGSPRSVRAKSGPLRAIR